MNTNVKTKTKFSKFQTKTINSLRTIFSYPSVVTVDIDCFLIGFIYRFIQFFILTYLIGYELLYKKGYQSFEVATGTVTSKVKGFGILPITNTSKDSYVITFNNGIMPPNLYKILDTADYIIPPNEFNSIFVMTNLIQTEQTPGVCEEDYTKPNAVCEEDLDCLNVNANNWNGIPTGRCIKSTRFKGVKVCEISAWCPVEFESNESYNLVRNVFNYTIFLRNTVEFKAFNKKERNILPSISGDYIARCAYERQRDPNCPVFLISDIISEAEEDEEERLNILRKGAIIEIKIIWDCNYDLLRDNCIPTYTFERFDFSSKESKSVSGFNFRYADRIYINNSVKRTLYKVYGIRFVINIMGRAGKFNLVQLLLSIGACLGLLGTSSLIADFLMLTCCIKKKDTLSNPFSQEMTSKKINENEERYDNLMPINNNYEIVNENQSVYCTNLVKNNTNDSMKNGKIHRQQQLIRQTILSRDGKKINQFWMSNSTTNFNEIVLNVEN